MSASDDETDFDQGIPGASARREGERRRANREKRTRERHPRIGGFLLAIQDEPRHERAWARGAGGEARVARSLAKYLRAGVELLNDRCIPQVLTKTGADAVSESTKGPLAAYPNGVGFALAGGTFYWP